MLKAGFARLDITPCLGSPLAGYFYERDARGSLDALEVNAVAVSDGENTVILLAADIIGCRLDRCDDIRNRISKSTGIPAEHVYFASLHQHTSVCLGACEEEGPNIITDPVSVETLLRKFADAGKLAFDDLKDATASYAIAPTSERLAFTRRYFLDDGSVVTNPPANLIPRLVRMVNEPDNNVRLVKFSREGAKDIAIVNFSTHPDVIGGHYYSADWCGFTRRFVEADNSDVSCMYINGAEGDSNHVDFIGGKRTGYEHSRHMGRVIADAVKSVWNSTTPVKEGKVFGGTDIVYNKTNMKEEERYDECKKFLDDYYSGNLGYKPHITQLADARRIVEIRTAKIYRPVPVSVVGFGDVAFVGFGGEPFVEYGDSARAVMPDRFVLATCCTNGYEGYLPTAKAFEEGGYEAKSSRFTPNLQDQCMEMVGKILAENQ